MAIRRTEGPQSRIGPVGVIGTRAGQAQAQAAREMGLAAQQFDAIATELWREKALDAQEAGRADAQAAVLERDENGIIRPPSFPEGDRYYDRAHAAALRQRYANEVEADIRGKLGTLAVTHAEQPEAFEAAAREVLTTQVGVVDPSVRGAVALAGRTLAQEHLNKIRSARMAADKADARLQLNNTVNQGLVEVYNYAASGATDSDAGRASMARMEIQIAMGLEARTISEGEAQNLRRGMQTALVSGAVMRELRGKSFDEAAKVALAIKAGPGSEGWQEEWGYLTPKEREALAGDVMGIVNAKEQIERHKEVLADRATTRQMAVLTRQLNDYISQGREPPKELLDRLSVMGTSGNPAAGMSLVNGVTNRWEIATGKQNREDLAAYEIMLSAELKAGRVPLEPDVDQLMQQGRSASFARAMQESYARTLGTAVRGNAESRSFDLVADAFSKGTVIVAPTAMNQRSADQLMATLHEGEQVNYAALTPDQQSSLMKIVKIGVVPAQAVKFMATAIRSLDSEDTSAARAGLALFQKIQADPTGLKALTAADGLPENVRDAYLAMGRMVDMGGMGEAGRKHVIDILAGNRIPEAERLYFMGADNAREAREELVSELGKRAGPALSGVGVEGGTPFYKLPAKLVNWLATGEPGFFDATMGSLPRSMVADYEKAAEAMSATHRDKNLVLDQAFKSIGQKWSQTRYGIDRNSGSIGDYRWAPFAPESQYPLPKLDPLNSGFWIPDAVKAAVEANAHPDSKTRLEGKVLGRDYLLQPAVESGQQLRNKLGKPLYNVVVVQAGSIGEYAYDKNGGLLRVDLAPAYMDLVSGKDERMKARYDRYVNWIEGRKLQEDLDASGFGRLPGQP